MKRSRRSSSSTSTTTTTVIHTFYNDHITPPSTKEIPIQTPSPATKSTVQTNTSAAAAAARIQSGYRSSKIRALYRTISSVDRDANRAQSLIQRQETVDAIRTDEKERVKMNETLMRLLLKLDSVPGLDPSIREARRKVSRKIVGMQEVLDSISGTKDANQWWSNYDLGVEGGGAWPLYWEEAVEEEMCREKGGEEMEKFCAQYLGFRCFQRFLRE